MVSDIPAGDGKPQTFSYSAVIVFQQSSLSKFFVVVGQQGKNPKAIFRTVKT